jgi:hypothetical protein
MAAERRFLHLNSLATPAFLCAAVRPLVKSLFPITLALVFSEVLAPLFAGTANDSPPEAEAVVVEDLAGQPLHPFSAPNAKAFLFIFVSLECPISNSYVPEFNRLNDEFGPKGVVMKLVYPNRDETAEKIRQHARQFDLKVVQVRDPKHALVKAAGAKVTPEAAVYVRGHGFVYCGRIDNRFVKLGVARPEATEHNLREALTTVLKGGLPSSKPDRGVGCAIPPVT